MNAVALVQRGVSCDAIEQERQERHVILLGKGRIHLMK